MEQDKPMVVKFNVEEVEGNSNKNILITKFLDEIMINQRMNSQTKKFKNGNSLVELGRVNVTLRNFAPKLDEKFDLEISNKGGNATKLDDMLVVGEISR